MDLGNITQTELEDEPAAPSKLPSSPYMPHMGAQCLRRGIDECYEDEIYLWCRIVEYGTESEWELSLGVYDEESPLPWWWDEISDTIETTLYDSFEDDALLNWALHHGLCPNQEFVLWISKPRWVRCNFEYEEYDLDYEVCVVRIEPPETSAREFERMIVDYFQMKRNAERRIQDLQKARWDATSRMYLAWYSFGGWYGCETKPWTQVSLNSTLIDVDRPENYNLVTLATGHSSRNDREEALQLLEAQVKQVRPDLNLRSLPVRRM